MVVEFWLESALFFYLFLFLLCHFLQSVIFVSHEAEQSVKHIFLKTFFALHDAVGVRVHFGFFPNLGRLLLFLFQLFQVLFLVGYDFLESLVEGSQEGLVLGGLFVGVGPEGTVFFVGFSQELSAFL